MKLGDEVNKKIDPKQNYIDTKKLIGYKIRKNCTADDYSNMGFRCGLEIHQQIKTEKKLFCRCPAGIYQNKDDYDAEVVRHMRPTLSELGEYDGTALMEFKTRKNIFYRLKYATACTYEIDDTPPFHLNRESIYISLEIAFLLKLNIVGEMHIIRKQYLDGSIPTGFQRTAIIGIEGEIPLSNKRVGIIQMSVEEDSCREVSDIGHNRIYATDRLGMPLIEIVTYPELLTPDEAAEAGQYLRFLTRSTDKVRSGIGAGRQDVNVSVSGGDRVEIKGVSRIKWIPDLTHNEAYRQLALLKIKNELNSMINNLDKWDISYEDISIDKFQYDSEWIKLIKENNYKVIVVNLPGFRNILSFFTNPDRVFADEISDRLKVIACLEKPNMIHSEMLDPAPVNDDIFNETNELFKSSDNDAQIIVWGEENDIKTAIETIKERCLLAFKGVPQETRKALKNGTTIFERVLPGPNRMYPDTDLPPIAIDDKIIEKVKKDMPVQVFERMNQLKAWKIPDDTYTYILKKNLVPLIDKIINDFDEDPVFVGTLIGHRLKYIEGQNSSITSFDYQKIYDLFKFTHSNKLHNNIIKEMIPVVYQLQNVSFEDILKRMNYCKIDDDELLSQIPDLKEKFKEICKSKNPCSETSWIMGQLKKQALGNMELKMLRKAIKEVCYV